MSDIGSIPEEETPKVFTVDSAALERCPTKSLSPSHWRADGTCEHVSPSSGKLRRWPARHKGLALALAFAAVLALLAVLGIVLDGRGKGDSPPASPAALTAVDLAHRAGCTVTRPLDETPLFVQEGVGCADADTTADGDTVSYLVFGNNDGRDGWLKVAETFGDVGVVKGNRWVVEIPDGLPDRDAMVAQVVDKLGGEKVS